MHIERPFSSASYASPSLACSPPRAVAAVRDAVCIPRSGAKPRRVGRGGHRQSVQDWCRRVGLGETSDSGHLQGFSGLSRAQVYGKMLGHRRSFGTQPARVRQDYRAVLAVANRPRQKNPSRCEAQIKPSWRIWRYHGARQTSPPAITLRLPEGETSSFQRLPPLVSARGPTTGHVIAISTQSKARALKAPLSRGDSDP